MRKSLATALLTLMVVAAACGSDEDAASAPAAEETASETVEAAEETADDTAEADDTAGPADLQLASSDLGDILVDAAGNSLYLFLPDEQGDSTCYDDCEAAWPVVGEIGEVGSGVDESLLGTTTRTDGNVQATYNGWPLYYFVEDAAPGDVLGQGLFDVWYVVDASGAAIQ